MKRSVVVCLYGVITCALLAVVCSESTKDLRYDLGEEASEEDKPVPLNQNRNPLADGRIRSAGDVTWDASKDSPHSLIGGSYIPRTRYDLADSGDSRTVALDDLYLRLLLAARNKRGYYGNVLGGYKLGKREFIPFEYMNEYQKRLFGSVLNNYKFGKRVPEVLPENYVTGGQIYDNLKDDPRQRKRFIGTILGGYKLGKRELEIPSHSRRLRRMYSLLDNTVPENDVYLSPLK